MIATAEELAEIRRHALADYPSECCGVILEREAGERLLIRLRNIQDERHRTCPSRYPRTSNKAYAVDGQEWFRSVCRREDQGYRVAVLYHSHIDTGAYFSQTDRDNALGGGDTPGYPDTAYIVVSVENGRVGGQAAFRWNREGRDFLPVEL